MITLSEFESFLPSVILMRGKEYYNNNAVKTLKKMLEFPKGKEMTNLLVADFRIRYKRRPAMMELLREF